MLLESEQSVLLEKKIFHVDIDGDFYCQATEGIVHNAITALSVFWIVMSVLMCNVFIAL